MSRKSISTNSQGSVSKTLSFDAQDYAKAEELLSKKEVSVHFVIRKFLKEFIEGTYFNLDSFNENAIKSLHDFKDKKHFQSLQSVIDHIITDWLSNQSSKK